MQLGDYEAFKRQSGKPCAWEPDGRDLAWFGGGVVDGLCDVADEHLAAPRACHMWPAGVGCVPWLTSHAVVDRLLKLSSVCVVVDKGASRHALDRLAFLDHDHGFPNAAIAQLADMVPANAGGSAPLTVGLGASSEATEYEIEAIRVTGSRYGRGKPLVHPKMLVLGEIGWIEYRTPYGLDEGRVRFEPQRLWWGSNWTEASASHLEVGFVSDDHKLVDTAADFVADMIAFSEPMHPLPRPRAQPR